MILENTFNEIWIQIKDQEDISKISLIINRIKAKYQKIFEDQNKKGKISNFYMIERQFAEYIRKALRKKLWDQLNFDGFYDEATFNYMTLRVYIETNQNVESFFNEAKKIDQFLRDLVRKYPLQKKDMLASEAIHNYIRNIVKGEF